MAETKPVPGKDGNKYVPFEERTGRAPWCSSPAICPKRD